MTTRPFNKKKILLILPPIILGIVIMGIMKSGKQPPQLSETGEPIRVVRTLQVQKTDFIPIARGYGVVQPAQIWKSIAQVSGRIISMHPRLKDGEIIPKGDVLFQIDPVDYELNLAQAETQLAELDVQLSNTQSSLKIEQRNLALATKEQQRLQKLVKKGSVSQSSADAAERTMLSSTAQVQNLKNNLSLIPSQRKLQLAKVTQAQRDLDNSRVKAPFNLRIASLTIESDQYVTKGQLLFSGDSVDRVEIIAQVSMSSLKNLFFNHPETPRDIQTFSKNISTITGFNPTVNLDMGKGQIANWKAKFLRFNDNVDSQTRTMGVVVEVDNPLQKIIPGKRPPLSKGMFVEVEIAGYPQSDSIVVPRSSIRNASAYTVDAENRLEVRAIQKRYDQGNQSIIKNGLKDGDLLVLTDLIPAVKGMLLKPVKSTEANLPGGE
ncbi:MAG: efflux RND transporter periplasmic adaptor subunit [Gammaproteobacteria bacterium]|nr:efflux RND transporter periplasmic adaptor subunit [Gammaproteobacteria bacterium]